jgi:hypothetical protein
VTVPSVVVGAQAIVPVLDVDDDESDQVSL